MSVLDSTTVSGLALSPSLAPVVVPAGIIVPSRSDADVLTLDLGALRFIAALSSSDLQDLHDACADAQNGAQLGAFVDALLSQGHLRRSAGGVTEEGDSLRPTWTPLPETSSDRSVPDELGSGQWILLTPLMVLPREGGFEVRDHWGVPLLQLSPEELAVAQILAWPQGLDRLDAEQQDRLGTSCLTGSHLSALLRRLIRVGLARAFDPDDPDEEDTFGHVPRLHKMRREIRRRKRFEQAVEAQIERHEEENRVRTERTGVLRTSVVPVNFQDVAPLALGYLLSYAQVWEGGRLGDHYSFRPEWLTDPQRAERDADQPSVFLFSHYIWSSRHNLAFSEKVKAWNPNHVTVHGGPDVPKYESDTQAYFAAHPHVDVAVRGEGEVTTAELLAALAESMQAGSPDLEALASVPGISFRSGDRVVRTPDRERIADVDTIPSPYLNGLFDSLGDGVSLTVILETNRGCPYGCTFCDWGSATASRIRKFSLERVLAEVEWAARNRVDTLGVADANFGIFERDVAITERIVELKHKYGYPRFVGLNYAKNTIKHLTHIVALLAEADILTYGQLSLQSMDEETLSVIKRSNIKLEKYEALSGEFRKAGLPLYVDLMMGLPGATSASFRNDLQECIDRDVYAKVIPTQLLPNSPMNAPDYRREHGIGVRPGQLVTSAASFSAEDYRSMMDLRRVFLLADRYAVLRHIAPFVRQAVRIREIDFYEQLWLDTQARREQWPLLAFALEVVPDLMVPPVSWSAFYDELGGYLTGQLGIDDPALTTVLRAQHALVPARDRSFPSTVQLDHDYVAWRRAVTGARETGNRSTWHEVVPPLSTFGPGTLTVTDPNYVCARAIGHSIESDIFATWELESAVSRPVGSRRRFAG